MEVKIILKQNFCKLIDTREKNVGMHFLCRKSVVIMGSDNEKIKIMETVGVGGFNYIIVFFSNSDAIFITH